MAKLTFYNMTLSSINLVLYRQKAPRQAFIYGHTSTVFIAVYLLAAISDRAV